MAAASPRLRLVRMTDRLDSGLGGTGAEGEQQTERDQTELAEVGDEQRSNEHDHREDGQHQPSPPVGPAGCRRNEKPRRRRVAGGVGHGLSVWLAAGSSPWPDETRP